MKTKLLITFLFLTLLVEKSISQTYIPMLNNSTWNIVRANFSSSENLIINPGIDIVIGSLTYKKFIDPNTNTDVFLREDIVTKKVYRRINGNDQILYDFSLQVSNNIFLSDGKNYTVQSISNVNVVGGTRRSFNLINFIGGFAGNSETWIEGIGSNQNPLQPSYERPQDPYIYLTCSAQNGINIYNNGIANGQPTPTDCSALLGLEEVKFLIEQINFSPNPFKTEIEITTKFNFENTKLKVFNSIGQLVKEIENINGQKIVLNRENLKSGIYFAQILQNEKILKSNKIIIVD